MSKRALSALPWVLLCSSPGGFFGCESDKGAPGQPGAPAPAAVSLTQAEASNPPLTAAAAAPGHHAVPCRAIAVDGDVQSDAHPGVAIASKSELDADDWLSLGPQARMVAKDPRTTRETTFRGPARVRACVDAREESWVAGGVFESNVGAGESPGAEEWVVTPLGVVRFAAAKLGVQVSHRRPKVPAAPGKAADHPDRAVAKAAPVVRESVRIAITEGIGFVWTAAGVAMRGVDAGAASSFGDEGWVRVSDIVAVLDSTAAQSPLEAAQAALASCAAIGKSAHDLATELLEGAEGGLGQVAVKQVMARRLARAACAVAGLRVEAIPPNEDGAAAAKDSAEKSLHDALALWREMPIAQ